MAELKEKMIADLKLRPNMLNASEELLGSLYSDAEFDILNFTRQPEIIPELEGALKDLISYRFNTLGVEGLKSESPAGVGTSYDTDIPPRVKIVLRRYRKLGGISVSE